MNQYRLHIDIPLGVDEEVAAKNAKSIMRFFEPTQNKSLTLTAIGIEQINYRLGYDEDRQKSNYLNKNENGHVTNKKIKISISG